MIRKLLSCVFVLGLALPSFSQIPATSPIAIPSPVPSSVPATSSASLPAAMEPLTNNSNKTDGLELPADQTVKFDEGFVTINAVCKGNVKWLVISATKIKYFTLPSNNTIVISVPPQGGLVTVFAVGLVDGKMTEFARTSITVAGNIPAPNPTPTPTPTPTPNPNPNPVSGVMHVTFVVDVNNSSPELGLILNSQKVREAITTKGAYYRLYDIKSPVIKDKGLDKVVNAGGGVPMIIIQNSAGTVVNSKKVPGTEAEVIQYLTQVLGDR